MISRSGRSTRTGAGYINSVAEVFVELGYERREELRLEKKKLVAHWFAPPNPLSGKERGGGAERRVHSTHNVHPLSFYFLLWSV